MELGGIVGKSRRCVGQLGRFGLLTPMYRGMIVVTKLSKNTFLAKKLTGKILVAVSTISEETTLSFKDGLAWTAVRVDGRVACGSSSVQAVTVTDEDLMLEFDEGRITVGRIPDKGPESYLLEDSSGALIVDNGA
ncbi:hypothetical protein [Sinorhizobium terangae]|uniref:hypothetical protein n=1 Tax=Sinorhizobium terangae TaxID=110322 RepID=UPI0024B04733|nr:hypothetical protein [Sinorhizobium terangae]WFU46932.1 hypothetical protein QA637_13725 [Sinorhizobium terangae]